MRETPSDPLGRPSFLPDDLAKTAAEPGELADNQAVSGFENSHQVVKPATVGRRPRRGGRFDELVDPEAVLPGILVDGEALALHVLAGGGDSEIGDGFVPVSTENILQLYILHFQDKELVVFRPMY